MIFRGFRGEKTKKSIPHDFLVLCDILEFLTLRLGVSMNFLEYTRKGTEMDDDGGFMDRMEEIMSLQNIELVNLAQDISDLRADMEKSVDFRQGHAYRIDTIERNHDHLREVVVGRNSKIGFLEQRSLNNEDKIDRMDMVIKDTDKRLSALEKG